eukprot:gene2386-4631_t
MKQQKFRANREDKDYNWNKAATPPTLSPDILAEDGYASDQLATALGLTRELDQPAIKMLMSKLGHGESQTVSYGGGSMGLSANLLRFETCTRPQCSFCSNPYANQPAYNANKTRKCDFHCAHRKTSNLHYQQHLGKTKQYKIILTAFFEVTDYYLDYYLIELTEINNLSPPVVKFTKPVAS